MPWPRVQLSRAPHPGMRTGRSPGAQGNVRALESQAGTRDRGQACGVHTTHQHMDLVASHLIDSVEAKQSAGDGKASDYI